MLTDADVDTPPGVSLRRPLTPSARLGDSSSGFDRSSGGMVRGQQGREDDPNGTSSDASAGCGARRTRRLFIGDPLIALVEPLQPSHAAEPMAYGRKSCFAWARLAGLTTSTWSCQLCPERRVRDVRDLKLTGTSVTQLHG